MTYDVSREPLTLYTHTLTDAIFWCMTILRQPTNSENVYSDPGPGPGPHNIHDTVVTNV